MPDLARHASFLALAVASLAIAACTPNAAIPSPSANPSDDDQASADPSTADPAAIGRAYVECLGTGDWAGAEAMQDATMRSGAPAATLDMIWGQIVGQFGDYGGTGEITTSASGEFVNAT